MTQTYPAYHYAPAPKRKLKTWHVVGLIGIGLVTLCLLGTAILGAGGVGDPKPRTPQVSPIVTASAPISTPSGAAPAAPAQAVTVKGKGNAAVPVGAVLNGPFMVEYSFGSACGIVSFLKADGADGADYFESINECSADLNAKASGSTVVHLKNVTLVKVENTRGNWVLTFKPIGAS